MFNLPPFFMLGLNSGNMVIPEGKYYSDTYTRKNTNCRKRSFRPSERTKSSGELHLYGKSKLARKALRGRLGL